MCDVVCSAGLDRCVMTCIHNYSITYSRFIALKILCALPIHLSLPLPLAITDFLIVSMVLPFPECHLVGIMQYIVISDWSFLLCIQVSSCLFTA